MPQEQPQFVGLLVRKYANGQSVWIKCLRATAEYYGWTAAYDVIGETAPASSKQREFITDRVGRWRPDLGGRKLRICRAESREGYPAGKTNSFRISSKVRNSDLAELAHLTKADWHWMETTCGQRWTRDQWLKFF